MYHLHNQDVIYSTLTQPYTYQPTKNLFAMDGMVGYEQVDPLTFVWSIRPGMQFHNGDPVNSEAVAFSFGRLEKLYRALDGTHTTRTGYAFVDSFEATDELTVTENWARPNADAPVYRARHYYSFLNPRIVEEFGKFEGSYEHADGTIEDIASVQELPPGSGSGPYTMTKRDATGTRVERWPDYHKHTPADDGFVEDGPYIDAWETRIIPDQVAAKAAFLAGDLDIFAAVDPLELPEFEGQDDISVVEVPAGGRASQGMDGGKFHDKRSRQALQKAFDYEGFIAAIRPNGGKLAGPISDPPARVPEAQPGRPEAVVHLRPGGGAEALGGRRLRRPRREHQDLPVDGRSPAARDQRLHGAVDCHGPGAAGHHYRSRGR